MVRRFHQVGEISPGMVSPLMRPDSLSQGFQSVNARWRRMSQWTVAVTPGDRHGGVEFYDLFIW